MQLRPTKPSLKKPIIIAVLIVLVAAIAGLMWIRSTSNQPVNTNNQDNSGNRDTGAEINYNPPTEQERQEGERAKEETVDQAPPSSQTAAPSITITRAGQLGNSQPLSIRTIVSGTNSGVCEITLTRSGQTITKSFIITPDATSTVCNGDIPASEFSANGEWQLRIIAKNSSGQASAPATQTVNITR